MKEKIDLSPKEVRKRDGRVVLSIGKELSEPFIKLSRL